MPSGPNNHFRSQRPLPWADSNSRVGSAASKLIIGPFLNICLSRVLLRLIGIFILKANHVQKELWLSEMIRICEFSLAFVSVNSIVSGNQVIWLSLSSLWHFDLLKLLRNVTFVIGDLIGVRQILPRSCDNEFFVFNLFAKSRSFVDLQIKTKCRMLYLVKSVMRRRIRKPVLSANEKCSSFFCCHTGNCGQMQHRSWQQVVVADFLVKSVPCDFVYPVLWICFHAFCCHVLYLISQSRRSVFKMWEKFQTCMSLPQGIKLQTSLRFSPGGRGAKYDGRISFECWLLLRCFCADFANEKNYRWLKSFEDDVENDDIRLLNHCWGIKQKPVENEFPSEVLFCLSRTGMKQRKHTFARLQTVPQSFALFIFLTTAVHNWNKKHPLAKGCSFFRSAALQKSKRFPLFCSPKLSPVQCRANVLPSATRNCRGVRHPVGPFQNVKVLQFLRTNRITILLTSFSHQNGNKCEYCCALCSDVMRNRTLNSFPLTPFVTHPK